MKEAFIASLEEHFEGNLEEITPLQKAIRQKAWDRFMQLGPAEKKDPGYQYFPLSRFYQETYAPSDSAEIPEEQLTAIIHPECRHSYVTFLNGRYSPELSDITALPSEVIVLRLRDALNQYGTFLQGRLSRTIKEEIDPFATLNIALIKTGLFIYVPPKVVVDTPIQCIHLISSDRPVVVNPRIHFFLGKESKVKWIYDHTCLKDFEYFSNGVIDIACEEGASFEQYGVLNPCHQGWNLEATRVTLKRDAKFKSLTTTPGTKSVRQDFRISLMGENASCDLKGVCALSENRQAHVNVLVDHQAPHCHSSQLFKNILGGTSKASFEGKILVQPEAQKTEAYQLNSTLLISDHAVANSKPNLEIFADDVKASHGATVTQVNPEHLLYLKSRGIGQEVAKKLLVAGFSLDILQDVPFASVRERMQQLIEKHLA